MRSGCNTRWFRHACLTTNLKDDIMRNVIITRSHSDNSILSQKITALGLNPISSPMISHTMIPYDFYLFKPYKDLIVTSKFAAQIISKHYPYDINAYVVGDESAEILALNPQIHVKNIYDTIDSLLEKLPDFSTKPLYLSGNYISSALPFADRNIIYNTEYACAISSKALKIIGQNKADFLMFYSKNSAQNFIDLIKDDIHLQNLQNSVVIAISQEVGTELREYVKDVLVPDRPNAEEMLGLLRL